MTTRYPKKGKGAKFTVIELSAIPAIWKGDKLSEERLQGEVKVASDGAVTVAWKTPYKWEGKLAWYYCGTTPHATLESIREQRDWCRDQVKEGRNPADKKKLDKLEARQEVEAGLRAEEARKAADMTLDEMVKDWFERGVKRQDDNAEVLRGFKKDILSELGDRPVRLVSDRDIAACLKAAVDRDSSGMAVLNYRRLRQLYKWSMKQPIWRKLINMGQEGNPLDLIALKTILPHGYEVDGARDRILSEDEIRKLRDVLQAARDAYDNAPNRRKADRPLEKVSEHAIWICLSTLCRIGELTMTEWAHVDFKAGTWFIPKANTKEKDADLTIYLSGMALQRFRSLHTLTGHSAWAFPSTHEPTTHRCVKTLTKQVGDRQIRFKDRPASLKARKHDNSLVIGDETWTPHDLRRTGATIMQKLGVSLDVIDRCQNHIIQGSKVRRHYLHHDYADEKKVAWDRLGTRLQAILGDCKDGFVATPVLALAA